VEIDATSNGEPSDSTPSLSNKIFPRDHGPITCDMQASMLEQGQVLLQDIHHEKEIVSHANPDSGSGDALEISSTLQMEPCPPLVAKSLFAHQQDDNLFLRPLMELMLSCFLKRLLEQQQTTGLCLNHHWHTC